MTKQARPANDRERLEVTTVITPLSEDQADLREQQLAVIVRLLQGALEMQQSGKAAGR